MVDPVDLALPWVHRPIRALLGKRLENSQKNNIYDFLKNSISNKNSAKTVNGQYNKTTNNSLTIKMGGKIHFVSFKNTK